jgi:hypothetical protein
VLCKAHNLLMAERTFGKTHVAKAIHLRRRKCERDERFERLLGALTGLGFRAKESRETLERIRSGSEEVEWSGPIEPIVRLAVRMLS